MDGNAEGDGPHNLLEQLDDSIKHFEVTHPDLTDMLGRLLNALGSMGI